MTAAAPTVVPVRQGRRLRIRHLWLVPGLALAFYANAQSQHHGLGIIPLLVFGILPHVPALGGLQALRLFNAMHHPLVPLIVIAVTATVLPIPILVVGGLAWLSHVVVDWALGDGIRQRDGSRRGPASLIPRLAG